MDIDFWTKWVTLAGAVVAAISGGWGLALQLRGKHDVFKLGLGTISPQASAEEAMHVVSASDHPIKLADYGFIEADGRLHSIFAEEGLADHIHFEGLFRGSLLLENRGDSMEVGWSRRERAIGCFARTNLQSRPMIVFDSETGRWARLWIRLRTLWKGRQYLS